MDYKFDLYDILGTLIPGALLSYIVVFLFPGLVLLHQPLTEAASLVIFTAAAVFMGQLIQALGSLVEPVVFGRFREEKAFKAFKQGRHVRYLPQATARRIHRALNKVATRNDPADGTEHDTLSDRDLFFCATQRAHGLSARFNALYAYHRGLMILVVVTILLCVVSRLWGSRLSTVSFTKFSLLILALSGVLTLTLTRARQRSSYYVAQVLLEAERSIEEEEQDATQRPESNAP